MSLYNCFSNELCTNLDISIKDDSIKFNSNDTNYKLYLIPIRFNTKYTIAIDSANSIELCCTIYDKYNYANTAELNTNTYKKINNCQFNEPFIYSAIPNSSDTESVSYEPNLKLVLKVPATNDSSIVILEGEHTTGKTSGPETNKYLGCNDTIISLENAGDTTSASEEKRMVKHKNYSVVNHEYADVNLNQLKSSVQLLQMNTRSQHPFADRLVEYLIGNVVTSEDEIFDNVLRVQEVMRSNNITGLLDGVWDDKMNVEIYEFMHREKFTMGSAELEDRDLDRHDILGYLDKDAEKYYQAPLRDSHGDILLDNKKKPLYVTVENVDLYPNIYKDSKVKEGR